MAENSVEAFRWAYSTMKKVHGPNPEFEIHESIVVLGSGLKTERKVLTTPRSHIVAVTETIIQIRKP